MRRAAAGLGLAATLFAVGCTVSRAGTLELLPGGSTFPVKVSVEGDAVSVRGTDPATGEAFDGRLAKVVQKGPGSGSWYPSPAGPTTPSPGGLSATGGASGTQTTIDVAGDLSGDRGTTLRCVAQVERRLYLAGGGICRVIGAGEDAPTYRLKF